ncbi:PAS domain-containing protein [Candidatus Dependentiae bacterium]|nr:PAS domain-containing protein [Candidatus Dependentiae bacterium]
MEKLHKTLWELLWDYDPNGLIVADSSTFKIKIVNPSFCRMFSQTRENIIGKNISEILNNESDFKKVCIENIVIHGKEANYPELKLYVKQLIFKIPDENIVACIMVDISAEYAHNLDMMRLKEETIEKVNKVVDKQMKVAQEIAGLLGETTAETKSSLLKLIAMLKKDIV